MDEIRIGRYRHFKGNEYEVIGIARHSETEEALVVYRALYGEGELWVRPASMWNETVERDGKVFKRFTFIGDEETAVEEMEDDEDEDEYEDEYRKNGRPVVVLENVLFAFEAAERGVTFFYDLKENDTIMYSEMIGWLDADRNMFDIMDEDPCRFIRLPDQREIDEYGIIQDFVEEVVPAGGIRSRFEQAIDGRGAFRRFFNLVDQIGYDRIWVDYRRSVIRRKAIEWCEENELDYE